ncbi:MAG: zeta toxin family protein [Waterburya sp.]
MTSAKPILTVIAGSNGSDKSTFTRYTQETLGVPIIDPDLEARIIRPDAPETAAIAGGKHALVRARTYLANNRSFAVETTLSGNTYLKMMTQTKQKGWQVNLIYVGVNDVQINIKRVAQRVAQGGHNVPQQDVRRRYTRSLANLAKAIQKADQTIIYDNSTAVGYQPILTIEAGRVTKFIDELPESIKSSLPPELIA